MSGGVDSAVALLRALPNAVGVTLRLWLDPAGPDAERACCSPESGDRGARDVSPARRAARDARPARGVPPRGRRSVRARLRAGRDAESVHPLQRRLPLRRAARVRRARRRRPPRDRPLRAHRRARRRGCCSRAAPIRAKDQSYMLARLDPRKLERVSFPLGEQDKAETRAEAERAGLAAARKPESQEACFLAGDDYRAFLGRQGLEPQRRARSSTRTGASSDATTASGGSRRASAAGSASPRPSRSTCSARGPRRTPSSSARARRSRAREVAARGRLYADVERVEAKLRYRSPAVPAPGRADRRAASGCSSTSPPTASRPARQPCSTRATPSSAMA